LSLGRRIGQAERSEAFWDAAKRVVRN
jgi:hypothetical protein